MTPYDQAKFDYGSAVALQKWHEAEEALERMVRNRENDECLGYLTEQVANVKARTKQNWWQLRKGVRA